jgi:aminoglycoside phosphotransferase (APT) family kinase protein
VSELPPAARAAVPGPLIATGRSAEIYAVDEGRVLRRRRGPKPIPPYEAAVMSAVRAAGFPAPEVFSVDGSDMVLERIVGVDMVNDLMRHPWRARRFGSMLAELHVRLAAVPVPEELRVGDVLPTAYGEPEVIVHGDLHPLNVILTRGGEGGEGGEGGPVVIDWEGARLGPSDADAAITWLLLEVGEPDDVPWFLRPVVSHVRRQLRDGFLAGVPRPRAATIRGVCDARLLDQNLKPLEHGRIREFRERHG